MSETSPPGGHRPTILDTLQAKRSTRQAVELARSRLASELRSEWRDLLDGRLDAATRDPRLRWRQGWVQVEEAARRADDQAAAGHLESIAGDFAEIESACTRWSLQDAEWFDAALLRMPSLTWPADPSHPLAKWADSMKWWPSSLISKIAHKTDIDFELGLASQRAADATTVLAAVASGATREQYLTCLQAAGGARSLVGLTSALAASILPECESPANEAVSDDPASEEAARYLWRLVCFHQGRLSRHRPRGDGCGSVATVEVEMPDADHQFHFQTALSESQNSAEYAVAEFQAEPELDAAAAITWAVAVAELARLTAGQPRADGHESGVKTSDPAPGELVDSSPRSLNDPGAPNPDMRGRSPEEWRLLAIGAVHTCSGNASKASKIIGVPRITMLGWAGVQDAVTHWKASKEAQGRRLKGDRHGGDFAADDE